MRFIATVALLGIATPGSAADLARLPPNTWVEVKYATEQPADPDAVACSLENPESCEACQ